MRASRVRRSAAAATALVLAGGLTVLGAPAGQAGGPFDVAVTKADSPDPVVPGAQLTYTINLSVSNIGVFTTVNDALPAQTTFVSVTPPVGWSCTNPAVGSGGTVSCSGSLFVTVPVTITLVVRVNPGVSDGTTISNTATAPTGALSDSDPSNNSATATTTVRAAAVAPVATPPAAGVGVGAVDALPAVPVTGIPTFTG